MSGIGMYDVKLAKKITKIVFNFFVCFLLELRE